MSVAPLTEERDLTQKVAGRQSRTTDFLILLLNFKNEYFILGYKDEIKIEGKFFGLTSQILRNGEVMGTIRRQVAIVNDAFELEAKEEDIPFLIALVIALDNIVDKKKN